MAHLFRTSGQFGTISGQRCSCAMLGFGPNSVGIGICWLNSGQFESSSGLCWSNSAQCWLNLPGFGPNSSELGPHQINSIPMPVDPGQMLVEVGRRKARFGRFRDRVWSKLAEGAPARTYVWPSLCDCRRPSRILPWRARKGRNDKVTQRLPKGCSLRFPDCYHGDACELHNCPEVAEKLLKSCRNNGQGCRTSVPGAEIRPKFGQDWSMLATC